MIKMQDITKSHKISMVMHVFEDIKSNIQDKKLEAGVKLKSEGILAKVYGATLHQIRQALELLKDADLVYSLPKVGVFVAEPQSSNDDIANSELVFCDESEEFGKKTSLVHNPIVFMTGSNSPTQQSIWSDILVELSNFNAFIDVSINYNTKVGYQVPPPDLRECSAPLKSYQAGEMSLLNMRDFFIDSSCSGLVFLSDYELASSYSTNLLFYNRQLLEKSGFAVPTYHNYIEQLEYLDYHLGAVVANSDFSDLGSTQQPITRLGHYLDLLFRALSGCETMNESEFMKLFIAPCENVINLRRKYSLSPPQQSMRYLDAFIKGNSPFYLGTSSDVLTISQCKNSEELEMYPFFSVDDSSCLIPLSLVISADTSHPIECIRFLQFLQQDLAQKKFADNGFIPIKEEFISAHYQPTLFGGLKHETIFFRSKEEHYIIMNILNIELWDCILNGKSVKEALNNSRVFAKAYMNMKLDKNEIEKRQKWLDIYS